MTTTVEGSFVVMVAIYSRDPDYILLIRNLREEKPCWKFIGESNKPGESPADTLIRGTWAEGGFWMTPDDPDIYIEEVRPPLMMPGKTIHQQYFFKIRLPYERLHDLSGKKFPGDDPDEFFETREFQHEEIDSLKNFLKPHRQLLNQFLGYPPNT